MLLDPTYLLYLLPVMLISILAQIRVSSAFKKYSKVSSRRRITGGEAARIILDRNGLHNVKVERIAGKLTDHYDPRSNVIRLSEPVYDSDSIAAVGIAAHEAGHAVQYKTGYAFIKARAAIIPISGYGASFAPMLIFLGFWMNSFQLYWAGIVLFGTVALFQLITLPVEFNASRRAAAILKDDKMLDRTELSGAKKVLSAAALTYVAALLTSLTQLFYFLSLGNRRR